MINDSYPDSFVLLIICTQVKPLPFVFSSAAYITTVTEDLTLQGRPAQSEMRLADGATLS